MAKDTAEAVTNNDQDPRLVATRLAGSIRGQFLLSQALCLAIEALESVEESRREYSNIEDMKLLVSYIFPFYSIGRTVTTEDFVSRIEDMAQFLEEDNNH